MGVCRDTKLPINMCFSSPCKCLSKHSDMSEQAWKVWTSGKIFRPLTTFPLHLVGIFSPLFVMEKRCRKRFLWKSRKPWHIICVYICTYQFFHPVRKIVIMRRLQLSSDDASKYILCVYICQSSFVAKSFPMRNFHAINSKPL